MKTYETHLMYDKNSYVQSFFINFISTETIINSFPDDWNAFMMYYLKLCFT